MAFNINFKRFDRKSKIDGFKYESTENLKDLESDYQMVGLDQVGFNLRYRIQNYLAEAVMLGGNLKVNPTRIHSLRQDGARPRDDYNNVVVVTIYTMENAPIVDGKRRTLQQRKTEIRIPGKILNQGSVFISELDCYIMTESQLDATRELIAKDVSHPGVDSINIPTSMIRQDPAKIYIESKELTQFCIERQDKISIRIGVPLNYGIIPDIIKTMRIAILDSYFVPYDCYKLVYDPTLHDDEFVIENLHMASTQEFRSTFTELRKVGSIYLDHDEIDTLFGQYYGMVIFADGDRYLDYVHERKTLERFTDETIVLAERSGDPLLKQEISKLTRVKNLLDVNIQEKNEELEGLRQHNKKLKGDVKDREATIDQIRKNHDAHMSADAVSMGLENERLRQENDALKLTNERLDLEHKEKNAPLHHKATLLKTISDMMKSGWGLVTACIGGILSVIALCKKYNVKLSMGS